MPLNQIKPNSSFWQQATYSLDLHFTSTFLFLFPKPKIPFKSKICIFIPYQKRTSSRGVVVNVLDYDNIINEFELHSCYYVDFPTNTRVKGMNFLFISISLLFFNKDILDIN